MVLSFSPSGYRQHPDHSAPHRVDDPDGGGPRAHAPAWLRTGGRRQHGYTRHAGELYRHPEVQRDEEHEKGAEICFIWDLKLLRLWSWMYSEVRRCQRTELGHLYYRGPGYSSTLTFLLKSNFWLKKNFLKQHTYIRYRECTYKVKKKIFFWSDNLYMRHSENHAL